MSTLDTTCSALSLAYADVTWTADTSIPTYVVATTDLKATTTTDITAGSTNTVNNVESSIAEICAFFGTAAEATTALTVAGGSTIQNTIGPVTLPTCGSFTYSMTLDSTGSLPTWATFDS